MSTINTGIHVKSLYKMIKNTLKGERSIMNRTGMDINFQVVLEIWMVTARCIRYG